MQDDARGWVVLVVGGLLDCLVECFGVSLVCPGGVLGVSWVCVLGVSLVS